MSDSFHDIQWNARCDPPPLTTQQKIKYAIVILMFVITCYWMLAFESQSDITKHVCAVRQVIDANWDIIYAFSNLLDAVRRTPISKNGIVPLPLFDYFFIIPMAFMSVFYGFTFFLIGLLECHLFILSYFIGVQ